MTAKQKRLLMRKEVLEWMETLVWAAVSVVLLFVFVGRTAVVSGDSMNPGYHDGDRLIISNLGYTPTLGDVVVFSTNTTTEPSLIKRVIATGGQTVDINFETGSVTVDGVLLDEPYIAEPTLTAEGVSFPATVPEGHLFVMGDNRNHSRDSRSASVGMVDIRQLLGRVWLRFYPTDTFGSAV